jgi:hypothetical protein
MDRNVHIPGKLPHDFTQADNLRHVRGYVDVQ